MSSVFEATYTTTDLRDDHNQLPFSSSLFLQEIARTNGSIYQCSTTITFSKLCYLTVLLFLAK
jgi:hypothetical protein